MKHIALTPFGQRPVTAGLLATRALAETAADCPAIDKWTVLTRLRIARVRFGVTDRDLTVLAALLSFLPARELTGDGALVVYPSNAALSDRAHGMAESTLRRHLGALVTAGLICRQDSPNGKRYAARGPGGVIAVAFGFDLRPLLARAAAISQAATEAEMAAATLARARTDLILRLRDAEKLAVYLIEQGRQVAADWPALTDQLATLRRSLRRKMTAEDIDALGVGLSDVEAVLDKAVVSCATDKTHGNVVQNERQYQNSNTDHSDSEPCQETGRAQCQPVVIGRHGDQPQRTDFPRIPLALVLKACPDILPYAVGTISTWDHLIATADRLRAMMGISPSAWADARTAMGPPVAAVTLAGMLQRFSEIRNAGGYLRSLTRQASAKGFSPGPMIMALLGSPDGNAA